MAISLKWGLNGAGKLPTLLFHLGIILLKLLSSIKTILNESPQWSIIDLIVKNWYGWFKHSVNLEPKLGHHRAFFSNVICIHNKGLSLFANVDSFNKYSWINACSSSILLFTILFS